MLRIHTVEVDYEILKRKNIAKINKRKKISNFVNRDKEMLDDVWKSDYLNPEKVLNADDRHPSWKVKKNFDDEMPQELMIGGKQV